jgi:putative redox protein
MAESDVHLATAHLDSGDAKYAQSIHVGRHALVADEPVVLGGADAGPPPYGYLAAALAACTSITLRMYADKKGWELGSVHVDVAAFHTADGERLDRTVKIGAAITDEQKTRLAEIAEKTPVTKTLKRGTPIVTTFV